MDGGMGGWKTLGAFLFVALMVVLPLKAVGAESSKILWHYRLRQL